jgi:hypothetical protein
MADYLPDREAELVTWIGTFKSLILVHFADYGLSNAQATSYGTLATSFITAYNLAKADATRSPANIIAKNDAKKLVVASTRQLAGIIQKFPGTTDEMRSQLGLTVPSPRTPIPPPTDIPTLEVVERIGTNVRIRIHDGTGRRGRPAGVQGARVYSHVGTTAPVDPNEYEMEGQATRAFVDIQFPADTAPGTSVWFTACYYNPRGEVGPACQPVQTFIAGGALPMGEVA